VTWHPLVGAMLADLEVAKELTRLDRGFRACG
jgi:hypothetical protein